MKKRTPQYALVLFFPVVLFYYEVVFRLSTVGGLFKWGTVHMLLFCVAYSSIGYLLSTIFKKRKWNRYCVAAYLFVTAIPYLVWYFIYRKFKMLYDLGTAFGGASDALGGFSRDIFRMIFSWSGFFHIVLFLLPTVLYLILGKKYLNPRRSTKRRRLIILILTALIYFINVLFIWIIPSQRAMWNKQYRFETAVGNFGLMTGIRLDIKDICFGKNDSFELEEKEDVLWIEERISSAITPIEVIVSEESIEYDLNQLDIDFGSLEAEGSIASLNQYVNSLTASSQNKYTGLFEGKNLIFLTAEAFSLEVINPELTPTLYRLASKGIQFTDYYQFDDSGTTGGEYQNIFGMLPSEGGKSLKNTATHYNYYTIGSMLDRLGYYGQAFHNNSYTFYDRNLTHVNLGYSEGFMGYGNGMEAYVSENWPQSDLEMIEGTVPLYIDQQPFNIYYMTVSGHSDYQYSENGMTQKNWDRVQHLECSDLVKGYYAAQLELEDALTYLVEQLEEKGIADNTVICLTADHFPYGLDDDASLGNMPYLSELYGYDVKNVFQRDHNAWILWSGSLEDSEPIVVDTPTFGLDILPTLMNLFGVEFDSRLLPGRDVFSDAEPLVFDGSYHWKTQYGYFSGGDFVQTDTSVDLPEDYVDSITTIVHNKITYCAGVLENDYFRYLFAEE